MSAKTPHAQERPAAQSRTNPAEAPSKTPLHPPSNDGRPTENSVRARAYALWEHAGRPAGDGVEFWLRAEQELTNPL
jgi:hypothetical protein